MTTRADPDVDVHVVASRPPGGVVAAVDHRTAALPVLLVARHVAHCLARPVSAVHVDEGPKSRRVVEDLAARAGVQVTTLTGDPADVLAAVAARDDVDLLVLGVRGLPTARDPLGHVATRLVRVAAATPLLLVPPSEGVPEEPMGRVLAPYDADPASADATQSVVARLRAGGCEVIGLHVFDAASVPPALDHPGYGTASWRGEFARRHGLTDVELRRGAPARRILEIARDREVDLVVLAWGCVLDDRHGRVVAQVLAGADVPVMLVPTARSRSTESEVAP